MELVFFLQEIHIKNYIGSDLYNKISTHIIAGNLAGHYLTLTNTYLQPMLIHYAMVDYLPFAAYQVKNGGVFKHTSENAETVSKTEVDFLVQKARNTAEYYTQRFLDYINNNSGLFPEYSQNSGGDVFPDSDATFNSWVL